MTNIKTYADGFADAKSMALKVARQLHLFRPEIIKMIELMEPSEAASSALAAMSGEQNGSVRIDYPWHPPAEGEIAKPDPVPTTPDPDAAKAKAKLRLWERHKSMRG